MPNDNDKCHPIWNLAINPFVFGLYGVQNSLSVTKSLNVSRNTFYIKFFLKSDKSFWQVECLNTTLLTNAFATMFAVWSGMGIKVK